MKKYFFQLWGILRQGVKCKDCGIPVHRDCKNKLVAQCRRRKAAAVPLSRSSSFPRQFVPREPCAEPINCDFSGFLFLNFLFKKILEFLKFDFEKFQSIIKLEFHIDGVCRNVRSVL